MNLAAALKTVADAYRTAWDWRRPFIANYMAIRLVTAAIVTPLVSLLIGIAISVSGERAIADQEIARFLLHPIGIAAGIFFAGLAVTLAVMDLFAMTACLRKGERAIAAAMVYSARLIAVNFAQILWFGMHLVVRLLILCAPFLAAAGAIAFLGMREYDINYYLTYRPPAFFICAILIVILALSLGLALVWRLAGWAVALHIRFIEKHSTASAFAESTRRLDGSKLRIFVFLVGWFAIRLALLAIVAAVAGFLVNIVPIAAGANLERAAAAIVVVLISWSLANMAVAGLSNGALAVLLNGVYDRVAIRASDFSEVRTGQAFATARILVPICGTAAVAMIVAGFYLGGRLLEAVGTDRTVEIIAHRGAAGSRPENTMASIVKAAEDRSDWVEIDVQETADGEVVVAHDSDFMKLAGVNLKVWDATSIDIERIDIGSWFDPAYSGERTPSLRDALRATRGHAKMIIELKYYGHDERLEERVATIVEETAMENDVAIMSLKYDGVKKMKALRPEWRYGVLAARAIGDISALDVDFVAVNTGQVSLSLLRRARSRGKQVYAWTVDDPMTMSRMISMGIDGLITNEPALARQVMEARNNLSTPERLMLWIADRFRIRNFDLVAEESDA